MIIMSAINTNKAVNTRTPYEAIRTLRINKAGGIFNDLSFSVKS